MPAKPMIILPALCMRLNHFKLDVKFCNMCALFNNSKREEFIVHEPIEKSKKRSEYGFFSPKIVNVFLSDERIVNNSNLDFDVPTEQKIEEEYDALLLWGKDVVQQFNSPEYKKLEDRLFEELGPSINNVFDRHMNIIKNSLEQGIPLDEIIIPPALSAEATSLTAKSEPLITEMLQHLDEDCTTNFKI